MKQQVVALLGVCSAPPALEGTSEHLPPKFLHISREELLIKLSQALNTFSHPSPSSPLSQPASVSGGTTQRWVPTWGHQGEMGCGQNHGVPPPCLNILLLGAGPGGGADGHLRGHHSFPGREGQVDSRGAPGRGVRGSCAHHPASTLPWTTALMDTWILGCKPPPAASHRAQVLLPLGARFAVSRLCPPQLLLTNP